MLWIFCEAAAILLAAISFFLCANRKLGSLRVVSMLFCLIAATYIAYIPPFVYSYDTLSGLIGNLIHVFQVISLDADYMEFRQLIRQSIPYAVPAGGYMVLLGILHAALPTISALTAVTLLFRCFSSLQLLMSNRRNKPIFIFSELNERSKQLTASISTHNCDIVFAHCTDSSLRSDKTAVAHFILREDSITELKPKIRAGKEIYYFCLSENEDQSLSDFLSLIESYGSCPQKEQEHIHLFQISRCKDYSVYVDSAQKGDLDIQCITENELLVYHLLNQYPLYQFANSGYVHVLLCGLSAVNITALKTIAWCGQLCGLKLKLSVVGIGIQSAADELKTAVPMLFTGRYDIHFYDCLSEKELYDTICASCADANYIVVSGASDNDTMQQGLALRRLFYRLDPQMTNCPPVFCCIHDPSKSRIVANLKTAESNPARQVSYSLIPFGSLDQVFTYENLVDSELEKLSKNVHLAYEEIFSDGEIDVTEAIKRYKIFEVNKRSNRANALHIRYKLNLLGLDYTSDPAKEAVSLSDYLDAESLEQLAVSEHERWMAFLEMEGWLPASFDEVQAYQKSGISKGRHNCPLLKMHPYICDYDKLKALSMKLEGKDTTIYDKELITKIPDILGDKWKLSGTQYHIIKLPCQNT